MSSLPLSSGGVLAPRGLEEPFCFLSARCGPPPASTASAYHGPGFVHGLAVRAEVRRNVPVRLSKSRVTYCLAQCLRLRGAARLVLPSSPMSLQEPRRRLERDKVEHVVDRAVPVLEYVRPVEKQPIPPGRTPGACSRRSLPPSTRSARGAHPVLPARRQSTRRPPFLIVPERHHPRQRIVGEYAAVRSRWGHAVGEAVGQEVPNGLTYGMTPTIAHGCILPDYTLTWVMTLWDYYYQAGDKSIVAEQADRMRRALAYFEGVTAGNGLLPYDQALLAVSRLGGHIQERVRHGLQHALPYRARDGGEALQAHRRGGGRGALHREGEGTAQGNRDAALRQPERDVPPAASTGTASP